MVAFRRKYDSIDKFLLKPRLISQLPRDKIKQLWKVMLETQLILALFW